MEVRKKCKIERDDDEFRFTLEKSRKTKIPSTTLHDYNEPSTFWRSSADGTTRDFAKSNTIAQFSSQETSVPENSDCSDDHFLIQKSIQTNRKSIISPEGKIEQQPCKQRKIRSKNIFRSNDDEVLLNTSLSRSPTEYVKMEVTLDKNYSLSNRQTYLLEKFRASRDSFLTSKLIEISQDKTSYQNGESQEVTHNHKSIESRDDTDISCLNKETTALKISSENQELKWNFSENLQNKDYLSLPTLSQKKSTSKTDQ